MGSPNPGTRCCRSKAEGEAAVASRWRRHVTLRPSIIFGPPPPNPIRRGQFLDFIDTSLAAQART
jgi:dTDP-4-dehydrorhamnose reductase